jgi:flagellar biosynthesis GTPase FlhF
MSEIREQPKVRLQTSDRSRLGRWPQAVACSCRFAYPLRRTRRILAGPEAKLAHPMLVFNPRRIPGPGQEMKVIVTVSLLACLSHGVLADDQATPTPTPTPVYMRHPGRPGSVRRMQQLERQRERETEYQSRASARAQNKANRRATAAAEAQARAADRAREQAQRQVDAERKLEKAKETPRATSDLMKRMGFSDQEIASQKALEESAKTGVNPSPSPGKAAEQKSANASPAPEAH